MACSAGSDWAERLNKQYHELRKKTVEGFIKLGNDLRAAREDIGRRGRFGKWCDEHLEFGRRAAQTFMNIAVWAEANAQHVAHLPSDWGAIDHITRLDDETLTEWVEDGTIHFNATRADIIHKITITKREERHRQIAAESGFAAQTSMGAGQFSLIYADPPWTFETFSERGTDRTPDNHYPVLSDEQIANIEIDGYRVPEIAAKDAVLLLWCTSSNIERALATMRAWGFTYKTQFVWDKQRTGTGYICLNQHEVLLYGTRGQPPLPLKKFPSLISVLRGEHSAKPPIVRQMIEAMFPHFNEHTRIEMFYRGDQIPGWTVWGLEALQSEAA
jgi:N6-adenosine-specific RNA methylase IME4